MTYRRQVLFGSLASLALLRGVPSWAAASPGDLPEPYAFRVMRNDNSRMGSHVIRFERVGDELHVAVDISLSVGFGPFKLFDYSHANREVWRDGRLVRMTAQTYDNGDSFQLIAQATAEGIQVDGAAGRYLAPPDTMTSTYWDYRTVGQSRLINTQKGELMEITSTKLADQTIEIDGAQVAVEHHRLSGTLNLDLWYRADSKRWVGLELEARGQEIAYFNDPSALTTSGAG